MSAAPSNDTPLRGWFGLLLVHVFLLQAIAQLLRIGTTYEAVSIGLDTLWVGLVGGAFSVLPSLFGLHLGRHIEHLGERRSLMAGSAIMLLASIALIISDKLAALFVANAMAGFSQFLCMLAQQSTVACTAEASRRDINFGHFTVAVSLAQALGPLVAAFYGRGQLVPDTTAIFWTGAAASALSIVVALLTMIPAQARMPIRQSPLEAARKLFRMRGFSLSTLSGLAVFASMDLLVIYMPLYGTEHGIPASVIGIVLSLRAAASMISRLMFGWLVVRLGRGRLLVAAFLLSGSTIALMPFFTAAIPLGLLSFASGLGLGLGAPVTLAWVSEMSPPDLRATSLSIRLAVNRVGQTVMPATAGALATGVGASGVLVVISAFLLVTSAVAARFFAGQKTDIRKAG